MLPLISLSIKGNYWYFSVHVKESCSSRKDFCSQIAIHFVACIQHLCYIILLNQHEIHSLVLFHFKGPLKLKSFVRVMRMIVSKLTIALYCELTSTLWLLYFILLIRTVQSMRGGRIVTFYWTMTAFFSFFYVQTFPSILKIYSMQLGFHCSYIFK